MEGYEYVGPLAFVFAQTLALAALFVASGAVLARSRRFGLEPTGDGGLALQVGLSFFLGLSLFLLFFVVFSRLGGSACLGLGVALTALVSIALVGTRPPFDRRTASALAAFIALVLLFAVSNLTCWLSWQPTGTPEPPSVLRHFAAIHAGRYANYAIFIEREDRIPFLAQNLGHSLLASANLILGSRSPLAALMTWIPVALAALTFLVFGTLRARGLGRAWSAAGTLFVMLANTALDWRHVLVFDNGSPLGLIGYADLIAAVATFIIAASWLERGLSDRSGLAAAVVPGLLACTWCWYAPQNLVLAGAAALARWPTIRAPAARLSALLLPAALVGVAIIVGVSQLGLFLPRSMREDVGTLTVLPATGPALRPYVLYVTSHWSEPRFNIQADDPANRPRVYEVLLAQTVAAGRTATVLAIARLIGLHLLDSLRVYFFPLLGLALMAWATRRARLDGGSKARLLAARTTIAFATFAAGFGLFFVLEFGGVKWWLARFLAAGSALAFIGLIESTTGWRARRVLFALVLIVALAGPVSELAWTFRENFIRMRDADPLARRLELLVTSAGPFK